MTIKTSHITRYPHYQFLQKEQQVPTSFSSKLTKFATAIITRIPGVVSSASFLIVSSWNQEKDSERLKDLTGGTEFVELLNKASPLLSAALAPMLQNASGIANLPSTLTNVLNYLLPRIFLNVSKQMYEKSERTETDRPAFFLADITAHLSQVVSAHCVRIKMRLDELKDVPNPDLHEIFAPMADELLTLFFPQGAKDFPFGILTRNIIWNRVKAFAPSLLESLYFQFLEPLANAPRQELGEVNGGELLVSIADQAASECTHIIPELLKRDQEKRSILTDLLARQATAFFMPHNPHSKRIINWLSLQLEGFGALQSKELTEFWGCISSYLSPFLVHVFTTTLDNGTSDDKWPAPARFVGILIRAVDAFWVQNGKEIYQTVKSGQVTGEALAVKFEPLVHKLLKLMGIDQEERLPLPDLFKPLGMTALTNAFPRLIADYFLIQSKMDYDKGALGKALRYFLFDSQYLNDQTLTKETVKELFYEKFSRETMYDAYFHKLWTKSGTHDIAATLEEIIHLIVTDLVKHTWTMLELPIQESSPLYQQTHALLFKAVDHSIKHMLLNTMRTTACIEGDCKHHPHMYMIHHVVLRMLGFFHEQQTNDFDKALKKVSNRLHEMLSPNPINHIPLDGLPGADASKDAIWESVRTTLIPYILESSISDMSAWINQLEPNKEKLQSLYHSTHASEACRVLAIFSSDFVRHYMASSHRDIAELALSVFEPYIGDGADLEAIKNLIARNIKMIAEDQHPYADLLWTSLTKYLEGFINVFFTRFSAALYDIEAKDPDFVVDTGIALLKDVTDYFNCLNKTTEAYEEEHSYKVPRNVLLAGFGSFLHPGVPTDPNLTEEQKNTIRITGCFKPVTEKLLHIAGILVDELPIPKPIRSLVGRVTVESLIPTVMMHIVNQLSDNNVRDQLMLSFVGTLYQTLNTISPDGGEPATEVAGPPTEKEIHLHETCGALIQELVKLVPDTIAQYVFMKEKVQHLSKQAIGAAMMDQLNKSTLMHIIDKIIYVSLPALHLSKWEGKSGREKLMPREIGINSNGKVEIRPAAKFQFNFPKTPEEIAAAKYKYNLEGIKAVSRLRSLFTQTISSQVRQKMWMYISNLWNQFQNTLNAWIEQHLSPFGMPVKEYLDDICFTIFWEFLGSILGFVSYPFVKLMIWLSEIIYIDRKSEEIIACLHADTLENLIYRMMDTFFNRCEQAKYPVSSL